MTGSVITHCVKLAAIVASPRATLNPPAAVEIAAGLLKPVLSGLTKVLKQSGPWRLTDAHHDPIRMSTGT